MGLLQYSTRRAYDCLNAYLTAEGDDEAAFIHHGSLVPTQAYLFAELYNRTSDMELVRSCYPRLRQYYLFFTGQSGSSTLDNLDSGLLRPWDYFYNSGGWDDYPPQKYVHAQGLEATCTPVVTTAHAIRICKDTGILCGNVGSRSGCGGLRRGYHAPDVGIWTTGRGTMSPVITAMCCMTRNAGRRA